MECEFVKNKKTFFPRKKPEMSETILLPVSAFNLRALRVKVP